MKSDPGGGGGLLDIFCGRDVPLGGLTPPPPYSYNGKAEKVYLFILFEIKSYPIDIITAFSQGSCSHRNLFLIE